MTQPAQYLTVVNRSIFVDAAGCQVKRREIQNFKYLLGKLTNLLISIIHIIIIVSENKSFFCRDWRVIYSSTHIQVESYTVYYCNIIHSSSTIILSYRFTLTLKNYLKYLSRQEGRLNTSHEISYNSLSFCPFLTALEKTTRHWFNLTIHKIYLESKLQYPIPLLFKENSWRGNFDYIFFLFQISHSWICWFYVV